jgi:hypothetical protein
MHLQKRILSYSCPKIKISSINHAKEVCSYIGVNRKIVTVEKLMYIGSEQETILDRINRAASFWYNRDPSREVVFHPIGFVCEWENMAGFEPPPVLPICAQCLLASDHTSSVALAYFVTEYFCSASGAMRYGA